MSENKLIFFEDHDVFLQKMEAVLIKVLEKSSPILQTVNQDEELTIEEVATLLKCTRQTIHNYVKAKVLKKYDRGGKPFFLKREVINSGREVKKIKKE
jgi:excisionase family DNA binding protein